MLDNSIDRNDVVILLVLYAIEQYCFASCIYSLPSRVYDKKQNRNVLDFKFAVCLANVMRVFIKQSALQTRSVYEYDRRQSWGKRPRLDESSKSNPHIRRFEGFCLHQRLHDLQQGLSVLKLLAHLGLARNWACFPTLQLKHSLYIIFQNALICKSL